MAARLLHGRPLREGRRLLWAALLLTALAGCAHIKMPWPRHAAAAAAPAPAGDGDIAALRQKFNQLVAYRHWADLAGIVAEDVDMIAPSGVIDGRKNLARSYENLVSGRPDLVQIFTPDRIERNSRWKFAAERGHWSESWQEQGEAVEVKGSYYAQWKLRNGRWRLQSQIVTPVSCKGAHYCKTLE